MPFHHGDTEGSRCHSEPPVCGGEESLQTATMQTFTGSFLRPLHIREAVWSMRFLMKSTAQKSVGIPHRHKPAVRNDKQKILRDSVVRKAPEISLSLPAAQQSD
jgi:hypothetical protein